jgi:predicted Zn-ribbon and HTH transcriptional regulator
MKEMVCLRCGYVWVTRMIRPPRECPDCKTRYWNIPRKEERPEERVPVAAKS